MVLHYFGYLKLHAARGIVFTVTLIDVHRGSIVQAIWPKLLYVVLLSLAVTLSHGVFLRFDFGQRTKIVSPAC